MKYKYKYITSVVVIVMVVYISTMSIITKDKSASELEGRGLQVLPTTYNVYGNNEIISHLKYIWHSFTGYLFDKWDDYFNDHIYARDYIVNIYSSIQKN